MTNKCTHLKETEIISQDVVLLDDGFAINGCCGGGCYVITGIKYCPFCGEYIYESN